jgi:hypothetical protein
VQVAAFRTTIDKVQWSLHYRGEIKATDLQESVLKNRWASKEALYSGMSAAQQQIEVWHHSVPYGHVGRHVDEATTLYIDGSLQASTSDEHVYYESLVHPAFLAHASGPSRVAIVSGDSLGATREVLRHTSVTRVDVLISDPDVPSRVKQHMPQLDNCSFFAGFAKTTSESDSGSDWWSCSNDDRVTVRCTCRPFVSTQ